MAQTRTDVFKLTVLLILIFPSSPFFRFFLHSQVGQKWEARAVHVEPPSHLDPLVPLEPLVLAASWLLDSLIFHQSASTMIYHSWRWRPTLNAQVLLRSNLPGTFRLQLYNFKLLKHSFVSIIMSYNSDGKWSDTSRVDPHTLVYTQGLLFTHRSRIHPPSLLSSSVHWFLLMLQMKG